MRKIKRIFLLSITLLLFIGCNYTTKTTLNGANPNWNCQLLVEKNNDDIKYFLTVSNDKGVSDTVLIKLEIPSIGIVSIRKFPNCEQVKEFTVSAGTSLDPYLKKEYNQLNSATVTINWQEGANSREEIISLK